MRLEFIGVYATSEKPSVGSGFPRPTVPRKRLWFVWTTPEGTYTIQALNAAFLPMAEPRGITAKEFRERFTREEGCDIFPEGYGKPLAEQSAGEVALPDLFSAMQEANLPEALAFEPSPVEETPDAGLAADDPRLLELWMKDEPAVPKRSSDATKIPFDRLMGEVDEEGGDGAHARQPSPIDPVDGAAPDAGEVEQVRVLRSQFVQALLLLRRGERNESIALLRGMLSQPYPSFEGAAHLFSEFGLGLRRLGLISLALMAHKRALEFAPRDARILFNIARSYHDLDYLGEAREYLGEALVADPDFTQARQFLAFLEIKGTDKR